MKLLLLPLIPLLLTACATAPAPQATTAAASAQKADGTFCERETQTGSMMPKTRCTTEAQREAERRAAASMGDAVRQNSPTPVGGGKGM